MIPQFALRLVVGLSLMWALLPRPLITSGFFRIQSLVALGLCVLTALTAPQSTLSDGSRLIGAGGLQWGMVGGALVSFAASVLWTLERRRAGTIAGFMVLGISGLLLAGGSIDRSATGTLAALELTSAVTSAALLGALTGGMLLGHWYLTATGMSLEPLLRATRWCQAAVAVRLASAIAGVALAAEEVRSGLVGGCFVWMLLRWGAGLIGPLALSVMTQGTLKSRNPQSATGVLFAAVILAFIGEAAALLLIEELGWPL